MDEITATITGIATAGKAIAGLLTELKETEPNPTFDPMTEHVTRLNSLIIEVQSAALALQSQNADLAKSLADLETQLAKMKDWNAEKENYELKAIDGIAFVYALKPDVKSAETPHWICCACYEAGRKSILAPHTIRAERGYIPWKCSHCDFQVMIDRSKHP